MFIWASTLLPQGVVCTCISHLLVLLKDGSACSTVKILFFPFALTVSDVTSQKNSFFPSSVVGVINDLLLSLYMVTWTMRLW